jgi:hypothetical protein
MVVKHGAYYESSNTPLYNLSMSSYIVLKKTLKLDPLNSSIIKELKQEVAEDKAVHDLTYLLFKTALFTSEFVLDELMSCIKCIHQTICSSSNADKEEASTAIVKEALAPVEGVSTPVME